VVLETLTHDLRDPVQATDGYAELVAEDLDDTELIDRIRGAATRITELTEATLGVRPERGANDGRTGGAGGGRDRGVGQRPNGERDARRRGAAHAARRPPPPAATVREPLPERRRARQPRLLGPIGALPDGFYVEDTGPGIPPAVREQVMAGNLDWWD